MSEIDRSPAPTPTPSSDGGKASHMLLRRMEGQPRRARSATDAWSCGGAPGLTRTRGGKPGTQGNSSVDQEADLLFRHMAVAVPSIRSSGLSLISASTLTTYV